MAVDAALIDGGRENRVSGREGGEELEQMEGGKGVACLSLTHPAENKETKHINHP